MLPKWRGKDRWEPIFISIEIPRGEPSLGEIFAKFEVGSKAYVAIVREEFVDLTLKLMPALIIADVDDGSYLLELPGETFSEGSRILVGPGDMEKMKSR
jgi:hypothetical protein